MKDPDDNGPISPIRERTIDHETMPHFQNAKPPAVQENQYHHSFGWWMLGGWLFFKPV